MAVSYPKAVTEKQTFVNRLLGGALWTFLALMAKGGFLTT